MWMTSSSTRWPFKSFLQYAAVVLLAVEGTTDGQTVLTTTLLLCTCIMRECMKLCAFAGKF